MLHTSPMSTERIQKILAKAGISSRRKAEDLITQGDVTVNGVVAKLGDKAEFGKDAIKVSGKLIHAVEDPVYYLLHKPRGMLSTLSDPENRPVLTELLGRIKERLYPVGRLDFNSDGAILMTNDGATAELLQKRADIPRVYHVKVKGHPGPEAIARLEKGAKSGNKYLKPHSVRVLSPLQSKSEIEFVVLGSGVFDVRAYFEQKGLLVDRVTRHALGQLSIASMVPGQLRQLEKSQIDALLNQPELGLRQLEFEAKKAEEKNIRRERFADNAEREERPKRFGDRRPPRASGRGFGKAVFMPESDGGEAPRPRSRFGSDRPRPAYGDKRPSFGDKRPPRFGSDRPRPSRFGEDRPRPAFGDKRPRSKIVVRPKTRD